MLAAPLYCLYRGGQFFLVHFVLTVFHIVVIITSVDISYSARDLIPRCWNCFNYLLLYLYEVILYPAQISHKAWSEKPPPPPTFWLLYGSPLFWGVTPPQWGIKCQINTLDMIPVTSILPTSLLLHLGHNIEKIHNTQSNM